MTLPPGSMLIASGILKVDRTVPATSSTVDVEPHRLNYYFDYSKLETFFQSINKQLFEAKCALQECVSEKMYRDEITQRLELTRKVDGSLVDINMIKDIMFQEAFQPASSVNSSAVLPSQKANNATADVKVLRGEIENMKMILRRMDLYHAEGIEVFSRLKRQEHEHQKLEDSFNTYRNSDLFAGIRAELHHLKDDVVKQLQDENKNLEKQIMHLEARMQQMESNMKSNVGVKVTKLEERMDHLEGKTYEMERDFLGDSDLAEGSDESDDDENKGIVHQIFRSPSKLTSSSKDEVDMSNIDVENLPVGLKHRYSIENLPPEERAQLLANYAITQQKQKAAALKKQKKSKNGRGRKFGGVDIDALEGKYVDVGTFQRFVVETQSIREDLLRFRMKMNCFECKTINNVFNKYTVQKTLDCQKRALSKWLSFINRSKEAEEDRKRRILQTFMDKIFHANTHHHANDMFYRWKYITGQLAVRDRIHGWVRQIARRWLERVKPNIAIYLDRWKKFTVMAYRNNLLQSMEESTGLEGSRVISMKESIQKSRSVDSQESPSKRKEEGSEESDDILPLALQLTGGAVKNTTAAQESPYLSLNELKQYAHTDLQIEWRRQMKLSKQSNEQKELQENLMKQLDSFRQQNAIDDAVRNERVYSKIQKMEASVQSMKQELQKSYLSVEEEKGKIKIQTDQQINQFSQGLNVFKNQVMLRFTTIKEEIGNEVEKVLSNVRLHQDSVTELRTELSKLTEWNKEFQDVMVKNMVERQADLNQQFQDIEKYMLVYRNKIDGLSEEVLSITDRIRDTLQLAKDDSLKAKEFQLFYDEELNWIKTLLKEMAKKVTDVKTSHEIFVKENNDRLEAMISADADDTGFRADGSITDRFKDLLLTVKKHFVALTTWFDFFYHGGSAGTNMLELFQFPQLMKNTLNENGNIINNHNQPAASGYGNTTTAGMANQNLIGDNVKKWEEMKAYLAEELTKTARRIAHIIAVKGDQQLLGYQVTSDMLQITPEGNAVGFDHYPLLHMDRSSSIQIIDPLGQIHYCEKSSQNIRQHYLQMIQTLLHHYLAANNNHNGNNNASSSGNNGGNTNTTNQRPGSSHGNTNNNQTNKLLNGIEAIKRKEKFIDQFMKLIDTCLTAHPLISQGNGLHINTKGGAIVAAGGGSDAAHFLVQGNNVLPGDDMAMKLKRSNSSRRPSSAHAAMVQRSSSRSSINQAALHNILVQSLSVQQLQTVRNPTGSGGGFASPNISNNNTGSNSANGLQHQQIINPTLAQQLLLQQQQQLVEKGMLLNMNSVSNDFTIDSQSMAFRSALLANNTNNKSLSMIGEMMSKVNEEPTLVSNATGIPDESMVNMENLAISSPSQEIFSSFPSNNPVLRNPSFHSIGRSSSLPLPDTPLQRTVSNGHQSVQSGLGIGLSESRTESFGGYLQRHQEVDREYEDSVFNISASHDEAHQMRMLMKEQQQIQQQQQLSTTDAGKVELHIQLSPTQAKRKNMGKYATTSHQQDLLISALTSQPTTHMGETNSITSALAVPNIQVGYPSAEMPSVVDASAVLNLGNGMMGGQTSSILFASHSNPNCIPEKFLASTIEKMQSIGDNYHHFSEKTDSFESSPSKGYVIAHSAIPQQILVDSIVSNYPKDITIRAKHHEAPYENLTSNEIGLVSRRLYGNHE